MSKKQYSPLRDISALILVISNILTIYFMVVEQWQIGTVLLVYWFQTFANGFFYIFRVHRMVHKLSDSPGIHEGQTTLSEHKSAKFFGSFFFLHFGGFLCMYGLFILIFFKPDIRTALPAGGIFFLNHTFSYFYNKHEINTYSQVFLGFIMPYIRNIPMHVIIAGAAIFSGAGSWAVVTFLILKTIIDVILHIVEHKYFRSSTMIIQ